MYYMKLYVVYTEGYSTPFLYNSVTNEDANIHKSISYRRRTRLGLTPQIIVSPLYVTTF